MAFSGVKTKLGATECEEYFRSVVYRNDFKDEDNTVLAVLRAVMNEERLAAFNAKSGIEGKMQVQTVNKEIRLTGESEKIDSGYYGGAHGPFSQAIIGLWFVFIPNKNASEYIKQIKEFDEAYKKLGWSRLEDVSLYLDRSGEVLAYQNEKKQATILFAPTAKRIQAMQMAASCVSRLFPWAFKNHPLTENELVFLKLLSEQKYTEFRAAMEKIYDAFDFYGKKIQSLLKGFCNQNYSRAIRNQEERVQRAERNVDEYYRNVRNAQNALEDEQMKLLSLRNRACNSDADEKELVDFFSANKAFIVLRKTDNNLRLGVNCYLSDYNEDIFKQYVEKQDKMSSYIYSSSPYGLDLTKKLFLAIWKEHRFNLRVYCEWILNDDCTVEAFGHSDMEGHDELMEDRIPQPHIDDYQCFRGYSGILNDLARSRDYIGIMSTLLSSSSSINWTDSTVVSKLMNRLFRSNKNVKCLEDKDGNHYTVDEVVKILEKESESKAA